MIMTFIQYFFFTKKKFGINFFLSSTQEILYVGNTLLPDFNLGSYYSSERPPEESLVAVVVEMIKILL